MADRKTPAGYENKTGTELEIFQKIEKAWKRNNPNETARNNAKSLDWFRKYVPKSHNRIGTGVLFRDQKLWKSGVGVKLGKMYTFEYDALHKDTLPFWDRYPLIFPFNAYTSKAGKPIMLGINLHYLPPALRMVAFKALLKFKTEKRYRKSTRLDFDWQVISALSESKHFEKAVHAYRLDHVRSKFVEVPAQSWEIALFLPTARWVGTRPW